MTRINPKAVVLGFLLMLALDIAVGLGQLVLHSPDILATAHSDEQVSVALDALTNSTGFLLNSIFFGTLTTLVGGYVAARIAKRYPYFNGLALGVLGALFGLAFWSQYPLWFNLVALVVVVPAALFGAHLAARWGLEA